MATAVKKSGYELSRELEGIKSNIERSLVESEGDITPEIEAQIAALDTLEGEAEDKIRAYQFVWQTIAAEQAAADARKGFHKDVLSRYDRTVKALEEAGKRIKGSAARLLRLLPEQKVKVDGRSVSRRLFYSVDVAAPDLAAEALKDTRCVKTVTKVDKGTWELIEAVMAEAKQLKGDIGHLAWAIDERLADEPEVTEHQFDKAAIKAGIDFEAYELAYTELMEASRLADHYFRMGDEAMQAHYEQDAEALRVRIAKLVPAGVSVSVNETVSGF